MNRLDGEAGPAFEVIRDPLWDNIRLDEAAIAVLDSPAMQRLRYVRQLGHAFLVYPGATHSRFEHALGTYHLTKHGRALPGQALRRGYWPVRSFCLARKRACGRCSCRKNELRLDC